MIRSLYLSGTNMVVQRKRMDVTTNNIANVETAGYKSDKLISRSFRDMLLHKVGDPAIMNIRQEVGPLNTGVHIDEVITSFEQGSMADTGNLTDVALATEGFFVVDTPEGERYTRDGSFRINEDGYLTTNDGYMVMGESGSPIQIENAVAGFSIEVSGTIRNADLEEIDRLRVVNFDNLGDLRKTGHNLYLNFTDQPVQDMENYEVRQGYLESSNVQIGNEIVDMMQLYRSYETSQRMVRMIDESLAKTVNEVGKV